MMTTDQFDAYFTKAQHVNIRAKNDNSARNEMLQLIEHARDDARENPPYEEFLNWRI